MKKYLGIFYKKVYMWLHYLPSIIIVFLILKLFHAIPGRLFMKVLLFLTLYIGVAVIDQLTHALYNLFGVKD